MDRRRSKKHDELSDKSTTNAEPTSGIFTSINRQRKGNNDTDSAAAVISVVVPSNQTINSGNQIRAESPSNSSEIPHLELLKDDGKLNNINRKNCNQSRREDFICQMIENEAIDEIQNIISQIAKMYLESVPTENVLNELANLINEKKDTQSNLTTKMATLDMEVANLEKTITQLQYDHDELKQMDQARRNDSLENNIDLMDGKHATEEKLKTAKASKTDGSKKK